MNQPPAAPPPPPEGTGGFYGTPQPGQFPGAAPPPQLEPETYGYVPVPNEKAPPGWLTSSERNNAMWSYLGALITALLCFGLSWIAPLVIRNGAGSRSPFVRDQATESLNFEIFITLLTVVGYVVTYGLMFGTVFASAGSNTAGPGAFFAVFMLLAFTLTALNIAAIVMRIFAAVRASQGVAWRYPINVRMLKSR